MNLGSPIEFDYTRVMLFSFKVGDCESMDIVRPHDRVRIGRLGRLDRQIAICVGAIYETTSFNKPNQMYIYPNRFRGE